MYTNKDITVVINTFNSDEQIYSCLDKVYNEVKVIIIENSTNQKFKNTIESKYPNVSCELVMENMGYGKGNNIGLKKVNTKFALILNPDAKLEKDTIKKFLETAAKFKDFAVIGPGVQEKNDKPQKNLINNKRVIQTENVKGFAMFLNLDQFKEIGFFDESFFIYFEEIDLCRRLKNKGKKIYLDFNLKVNHIGGSSHNDQINFEMELSRNWHWMWSTFYFHKKYNGFLFALLKIFPKLISSVIKIIFYSVFYKPNKRKIYFQRFSGLINSIMGKKSWYRPNILKN